MDLDSARWTWGLVIHTIYCGYPFLLISCDWQYNTDNLIQAYGDVNHAANHFGAC